MAWWDQYFSAGQRDKVPPAKLAFDVSNPRFTPDKQPNNATDGAIIAYLDRTADLGELIQSIAASGYIDIEPLIVIPRDDELVVLEGNRRLAALKSLLDPGLAAEAGVTIPEISPEVRATLQEVTAFKVLHEDEARNLIGFKHINGPQGWDAYAKALYAARWLDDEVAKGDAGLSLNEIAARMGDKHDTLYRIVSAVYVLQQAQQLELFRVEDRVKRNFSFSHLYTALTYTEFRDFVGLGRADRSANPERNPIRPDFHENLRTLLLWLYGSKAERVEPVIKTQNPDLSLLKRVLGHAVARKVMLERHDLAAALSLTVEGSDRFSKALVDAQASLHQAVAEITNADNDSETIEIADDIRKRATFIHTTLAAQQASDE
ncbi:ParB N-terminal domain-containing protein [Sphingopyxis granuli]|uniref:ParB N-terminal domain-containing protein n=1 Tax=Sphingopyxis granuli TaxID=267128 RepID=UPI0009EED752|nr:ParB N-terminal domain-containing protein [Sphingopyxis granuli]